MYQNRKELSLNELGLEKTTQTSIVNYVQLVVNKASVRLNNNDELIVKIPGTTISIVDKINQNTTNKKTQDNNHITTKQKLESTGLNDKVKSFISELKKTKGLKTSHINDIVKTCSDTTVSNLSEEAQMDLIKHIIENRNEINIRNCGNSSTLLVNEGSTEARDLENWADKITKTISELDKCLNKDKRKFDALPKEYKQNILDMLNNIDRLITNIINWLQ